MKIPDLNVLVAAFRQDHADHVGARAWLSRVLESGELLGLSAAVAAGVVRLLTNRRMWAAPDSIESALAHVEALRRNRSVIDVAPGARHWEIFAGLCREVDARGDLVSDAARAAIAIEHGATFVSFDRDFARFPGLRWELPS